MSRLSGALGAVLSFLKVAVTDNVGLKALALSFAIALFVYQRGQEDQQQRTIPVGVIVRLPPDTEKRELMTQVPASIHVTLRGTTRAIDRLIQTGVAPVELDLRDAVDRSIAFEPEMFSLPAEVEIKIIDPPSIDLSWDDVVTRQIPIQASITGKPAGGFVVKGEPEVDPAKITVQGPRSSVEVIQFARLAAFDVAGLIEGKHTRPIELDAPGARISYIGPTRAKVTVTIAKRVTEQKFAKRPVEVVGVARGRTIPKTVDVTVIGPPEIVKALRDEQVVPRVDLVKGGINLKEQQHGSATLKVTVELADAETEIQPPSVTVKW